MRSYPERELGPEVDGYPVGGESSWSANAELIHNLAGSVKAVAFLDAGADVLDQGWLDGSALSVLVADREYPIRASLRPMYDPASARVRV